MRIGVLSDLHIEVSNYTEDFPECDVLVLAGDIASKHTGQESNNRAFEERLKLFDGEVVRIKGNHEAYGGCLRDFMRLSQNNTDIIGGVRFICSTGWSYPSRHSWQNVNDRNIDGFTLDICRRWSGEDWEFIETELAKPFNGKTVVVTHYLPSNKSIPREYIGSSINPSFTMSKERIINKYSPILWIHGHTHTSTAYTIGDTMVVCNPRGYCVNGDLENGKFDPMLTIDI